jgi:spermidine/putrescine transport system substrate-binding protein
MVGGGGGHVFDPNKRSAMRLPAGLALIALLIAACSGAGASSPPASTTAPSAAVETTAPATPGASEVPPDKVTGDLTVLDWAGYDDPLYWQDFKDTYPNVNVGFEFGGSDGDIYSKMKAGDQADVFHPYTGWLQFYADEGLAAEIDTGKLSNWDKVPEAFKKIGQVDGKQYCVPYDWGFSSILYNTEKATPAPESWSALLDPAYTGHISMWDDGPSAVTVSSYIHGWDETQITADQLATIKQEWTDQAKLNKAYWVGEPDLVSMFQSGDATVAYAWQGAYATLLAAGVPVAYADPKEGRNSWVGMYCIRKDSPNQELALKFLDEKLGEKAGTNLVNNFYYGSANQDVMKSITDPTLRSAFSLDDPSILDKTNFTPNLTADQRNAWTAMWNEVKASQ